MQTKISFRVYPLVALLAVTYHWWAGSAFAKLDPPPERVTQWDIFELTIAGPSGGNPFSDIELSAEFRQGDHLFHVEGFYDSEGIYRVRFMPDRTGAWEYTTKSNCRDLDGKKGRFTCVPVAGSVNNHGPVSVHKVWHLAYADGTPYFQVGTTCYAWTHQGDAMEKQTLETLAKSPFNKIRMCVFPKDYVYNKNEPEYYPFEGKPLKDWDYRRFNPAFFRHFEKCVGDLRNLGIEADIILFHPYDRWGFASMDRQTDERYLRYIVARLAAFRNVWWSFANEYDLMKNKTMADWDRFFQIVQKYDPYNHMRGIHNCHQFYDHTKSWVTHASIQSSELARGIEWRNKYKNPIIYDECKYEGDIPQGWGNITAEEMTHRFWLGTISGCYVGHGETYKHPQDLLWWSKGGLLRGQSSAMIAFLKGIMERIAFDEMIPSVIEGGAHVLSKQNKLYLVYLTSSPSFVLDLPGTSPYRVDGIDTWNMVIDTLPDAWPGSFRFTSPKVPYLLRLSVYQPSEKLRPKVEAKASPVEGLAPLTVQFSATQSIKYLWDFGDGASSQEADPTHTYLKPGIYHVKLTVTDESGMSASMPITISVDRQINSPIVHVGCPGDESPLTKLHGRINRASDGTYTFDENEPWRWIEVGNGPIEDLEGLRSFTILGWARPSSMKTGSGGNRIAFNLNYDRAGFDLVCLSDGRLRLAVNEWPDSINNDSSPAMLQVGKWTFFAVTYDGTKQRSNVCWYFGDTTNPVVLDRKTNYNRGNTLTGSGPLTIGNYNQTIHQHGTDRQFRGQLRGIKIFGSRVGSSGALGIDEIRRCQNLP